MPLPWAKHSSNFLSNLQWNSEPLLWLRSAVWSGLGCVLDFNLTLLSLYHFFSHTAFAANSFNTTPLGSCLSLSLEHSSQLCLWLTHTCVGFCFLRYFAWTHCIVYNSTEAHSIVFLSLVLYHKKISSIFRNRIISTPNFSTHQYMTNLIHSYPSALSCLIDCVCAQFQQIILKQTPDIIWCHISVCIPKRSNHLKWLQCHYDT